MKANIILILALVFIGFMAEARVVNIDSLAREHQVGVVLDVSKHQGVIDFEKVASSVRFLYVRATAGSDYVDPRFIKNVQAASAAGMLVGVYHVYSDRSSPRTQAAHFMESIKGLDLDLLPVVDVERCESLDSLRVLLDEIETAYGVKPMVYSYETLYRHRLQNLGQYKLWIAKYSRNMPNIVGDIFLWQFSENGSLPGIDRPVDVSRFMGDYDARAIVFSRKQPSSDAKKKPRHGRRHRPEE